MPTYTYRCADCGHQFDQFQKFSDDPLTDCPSCAGRVRRVIHPVGVVFKGSGWYITDSRGSNGSKSDEQSDTAEKPAAKAEGGDSTTAKSTETAKPAESSKPVEKSEKKVAASA